MRRNVAPTKTNLLKTREELNLAELGYELLDQKRNILIIELLNLVDQAVDFQSKVEEMLKKAYAALEDTILDMGKLRIQALTKSINVESQIELRRRRVMGVFLPIVETGFTEHSPYYSPVGTSFRIEETQRLFKNTLELMGKLAELKISIMKLAQEVRKTIRKVNALEKIAIPDLKETVDFIVYRLEENERDSLIIMKHVKSQLESKK